MLQARPWAPHAHRQTTSTRQQPPSLYPLPATCAAITLYSVFLQVLETYEGQDLPTVTSLLGHMVVQLIKCVGGGGDEPAGLLKRGARGLRAIRETA